MRPEPITLPITINGVIVAHIIVTPETVPVSIEASAGVNALFTVSHRIEVRIDQAAVDILLRAQVAHAGDNSAVPEETRTGSGWLGETWWKPRNILDDMKESRKDISPSAPLLQAIGHYQRKSGGRIGSPVTPEDINDLAKEFKRGGWKAPVELVRAGVITSGLNYTEESRRDIKPTVTLDELQVLADRLEKYLGSPVITLNLVKTINRLGWRLESGEELKIPRPRFVAPWTRSRLAESIAEIERHGWVIE